MGKEDLGPYLEEQPTEETEEGQPERWEGACKYAFQRGDSYQCPACGATRKESDLRIWQPEQFPRLHGCWAQSRGWVGCEEGAPAGLCGP